MSCSSKLNLDPWPIFIPMGGLTISAKQSQIPLIALSMRGGKLQDTYLDALEVCHQAHALTLNSTSSFRFTTAMLLMH